MSPFALRLLEHVHGHFGWLSVVALSHPAVLLRARPRRALLSAALATTLVTLTGAAGALLYPAYRTQVKVAVFSASTAYGNAFERKEHLAVAAVALAWVGLAAHIAECRQRSLYLVSGRVSFLAYASAALLSLVSATLGVAVAAFRSF